MSVYGWVLVAAGLLGATAAFAWFFELNRVLWITGIILSAALTFGGILGLAQGVQGLGSESDGAKIDRLADQQKKEAEDRKRQTERENREAAERHAELARMVSEGRAGLLEKYPGGYVILYTDGRRIHEDRSNSGSAVLIEPHSARIRSITDDAVSLDFQIRQGGLKLNHENTAFPRRVGAKHDFTAIGNTTVSAEVIAVHRDEIAVVVGARPQ
jgi:hypothetical protein